MHVDASLHFARPEAPGPRTGQSFLTDHFALQAMYRIAAFLTFLICLLVASSGFGQDNNLTLDSDNLPEWRGNTRFLTSHFPVKHPSLSLNGFDCGSDCGNGYGLKQVLEKYTARRRMIECRECGNGSLERQSSRSLP